MGMRSERCVLVIDDDEDLRDTLSELVAAWGYKVRTARNGREGLEQLSEETPAVVFLDLMMPELDGWQFVDDVRRQNIALNIVVLTAVHPDDAPRGYPVLQKPFTMDEIRRTVESLA